MVRIIIILIFCSCLLACESRKKEAAIHYEKALRLKSSNGLAEASNEIDSALNLDTTNFEYYLLKAKIKTKSNQYEESNNILKSLIIKNYKTDSVCYTIGGNYFNLGQYYTNQLVDSVKEKTSYDFAVEFYDKAIQHNQYFDAYVDNQRHFIIMENTLNAFWQQIIR